MLLSEMTYHPELGLATVNLYIKLEVCTSIHYDNIKAIWNVENKVV